MGTIFDQARAAVSGQVIPPDPFIIGLFEIASEIERKSLYQPLPGQKKDIEDLRELGSRCIKEDEARREKFEIETLEFEQLLRKSP